MLNHKDTNHSYTIPNLSLVYTPVSTSPMDTFLWNKGQKWPPSALKCWSNFQICVITLKIAYFHFGPNYKPMGLYKGCAGIQFDKNRQIMHAILYQINRIQTWKQNYSRKSSVAWYLPWNPQNYILWTTLRYYVKREITPSYRSSTYKFLKI